MDNYEKAAQTLENAESWKQNLATELLKPAKKKFEGRPVYAKGVDSIWAVDLLENKRYIKENEQYRYILVIVDVFSKMAWAKPMKKKNAPSAVAAFEDVLNETGLRPSKIWADKGLCVVQSIFVKKKRAYRYLTYYLFLPSPAYVLFVNRRLSCV